MTVEQLLIDALHAADDYQPSPDLFAKVQRSIEEDAAHRRRVRLVLGGVATGMLAIGGYLALTVDVVAGDVTMAFTALEILVTAVMIVIVAVVGPAIRRFGELYERAAFRGSAATGTAVLRLLDIAYYLIFTAYIVMSLVFDPTLAFDAGLAAQLRGELDRVAGLLLLMGVLHVGLLLALPLAGLVHTANEWRMRIAAGARSSDKLAARVDKVITVVAWVVAILVVLQLVFLVLNLVLLGLGG